MQQVRQEYWEAALMLVPATIALVSGIGLMGAGMVTAAIPAFLGASSLAFGAIWRLFRGGVPSSLLAARLASTLSFVALWSTLLFVMRLLGWTGE